MKKYFYQHRLSIFSAIIVAIVSVLPYILPIISLGTEYKGIPFIYQDNEEIYLSRIKEVNQGHLNISSPVFYEYKDENTAQQPMGEWIYALFLTFLPVNFFVILSKFLFPAILFFLIYSLILRLNDNQNTHLAIFIATVCTLGSDMVRVSFLREIFMNPDLFYLSIWTRLVNPVIGAILLISFMHVLISLYERKKIYLAVISGIILGLMTGYYFSFIIACFILGFISLLILYKKDYKLFWSLILIFLIGFLVNINYAFNILNLDSSMALKSGMILTHMPLFNKIQFLVFLCLISKIRSYKEKKWIIATIFFLASICSLNLHVLTGKAIWPAHFVQYTNLLAFISIGLLFSNLNKNIFKLGYIAVFILSILTIPGYINRLDDFKDIQRRAGVFEWLNTNAEGETGCVVFSYEPRAKLTWAVPAYTNCDSYTSPYVFSNVPEERIMHNFLTMISTRGGQFDESDIREYFFRDWRDIFSHQPDKWLRSVSDIKEMDIYFSKLDKEIKENYKKFNFERDIKKYKVDYIIWDSINASSTNPKKVKSLEKVYENNGIFIYKIL